ncbi:MAG: NAD(P)H-dependent oxidoreductase subunit E [Chlamydiae bacterium]|nr:MAG: NAD(P)H-dependent oxidoreductase subunit E [Chlamydiota bacterium]
MNEKENKELYKQLDELIKENKDLPGPLIQILHGAQGIFGYLPIDVLNYVADKLKKPSSEVYGVATFYHLFHLKPKGKYQFKVCLGTACYIRGGKMIVDVIKENLGIDMGEVTENMMFSLEAVRCIGACGLAPVMMVNDKVYDKLISPAKVRAIIDEYKNIVAEESKQSA